jgi:hypothetical protein
MPLCLFSVSPPQSLESIINGSVCFPKGLRIVAEDVAASDYYDTARMTCGLPGGSSFQGLGILELLDEFDAMYLLALTIVNRKSTAQFVFPRGQKLLLIFNLFTDDIGISPELQ